MINEPYRMGVRCENTHDPLFTAAFRTRCQDRYTGPLGSCKRKDVARGGLGDGGYWAAGVGDDRAGINGNGPNAAIVACWGAGGRNHGGGRQRPRDGPRLGASMGHNSTQKKAPGTLRNRGQCVA